MPLLDALIVLILAIALIGLLLYLVNRFIPMEAGMKELMNTMAKIIIVVAVILWVLSLLGYGPMREIHIFRN